MWANENWTRRWDGAEEDVLLAQDYRPEDEDALLASFARCFADPRYIRVQGRPLLMLYRACKVPDAAATFARWRRLFQERHGEDPLIVMAQSFGDRDPRPYGLDGAVEFPPHKLGERLNEVPVELLDPDFSGHVHAYDEAADLACTEPTPPYPLIKTCVPSWDNDARRQGAGMVLHGASPGRYQAWLAHLVEHARANPFHGEPLVCINAWNEWAEGAYLEPDLHLGAAYLNATGRAVAGLQQEARDGALLLVGHDAFPAGSQHLLLHLGRQLRHAHGIAVQFLLLGGGRLLKAYQECAPTVLAGDDAALARHAAAAHARGTRAAIVNSAAAAHACAALREAGIAPTLLAHEMPGLLRTRDLVEGARQGVEAARQIVFASAEGRDRFASAVPLPPGRAAVLPQGLYAPARRTAEAEGLRAGLGIAEDAPLALAVGFGDLRKGFDLALKAWAGVQDEERAGCTCSGSATSTPTPAPCSPQDLARRGRPAASTTSPSAPTPPTCSAPPTSTSSPRARTRIPRSCWKRCPRACPRSRSRDRAARRACCARWTPASPCRWPTRRRWGDTRSGSRGRGRRAAGHASPPPPGAASTSATTRAACSPSPSPASPASLPAS